MRKLLLESLDSSLQRFIRYPLLCAELDNLESDCPLHILALGKAAWQMAFIATKALQHRKINSCTVLTKYGFFPSSAKMPQARIFEAGHPIPDQNSVLHSSAILELIERIPKDEELIILLSGGTSALFEVPAPGHSLEEIIALNRLLLRSGLDIRQINRKRQELSQVKGGKALAHLNCQTPAVYLLSDVKDNDPAIIGSAPFYEDSTDSSPPHTIIGDNFSFLTLLRRKLIRSYDGPVHLATRFVNLELQDFSKALQDYLPIAKPGIHLFGGELTASIHSGGKGGRCTHLALNMAKAISGRAGTHFLAFATDGNDNLSASAGAYVNSQTWQQMISAKLDPEAALREYDSFTALNGIEAILPGRYNGCNVNDVFILVCGRAIMTV